MRLPLLVTCGLLLSCQFAHGSSLVYDAAYSSPGIYAYDLILDSGTSFTDSSTDPSIMLTGLSGVTSAGIGNADLNLSFLTLSDSTSVSAYVFGPDDQTFGGDYIDALVIESSSAFSGGVAYTINGSLTTVSGTVEGPVGAPVSATPEPSSFLLLGTGLLGFAGAAKRRFPRSGRA